MRNITGTLIRLFHTCRKRRGKPKANSKSDLPPPIKTPNHGYLKWHHHTSGGFHQIISQWEAFCQHHLHGFWWQNELCNWQLHFWKAELDCTLLLLIHTQTNPVTGRTEVCSWVTVKNHWTISSLFWVHLVHTTPSVPMKLHFQHSDWTCTDSSQKTATSSV